jgi:hypothetical protein
MTWQEITQKVREGSQYPIDTLIELPYNGKLTWFRVVDHRPTNEGKPSLTLEMANVWKQTPLYVFVNDTSNAMKRYYEYYGHTKWHIEDPPQEPAPCPTNWRGEDKR